MLHTNERIIKHKVALLDLAEELGNIAKACKLMGVSRMVGYHFCVTGNRESTMSVGQSAWQSSCAAKVAKFGL